jgi:phage terminase small subunit
MTPSGKDGTMPALKNVRHELFCQGLVSGLSQAKAYTSAGYSERGAKQSAARLLANADVRSRVADLRREIKTRYIHLQITERDERLKAAQERWDGMREVIQARKTGDYSRALKTGLIVRGERVIGTGKNAKLIEEYEVDTGLLDTMAALEKQVAIETGQWTEKQDVDLHGQISAKSIALSKVMSLPELEELERKMSAAMEAEKNPGKVVEVPKS